MYLQRCLVLTWLVPRETAAASARSVYTIQPCTMLRHFTQIHIRWVHACLAVTCHLHFWQNDQDLLSATEVARWWNGHRNKNQHRSRSHCSPHQAKRITGTWSVWSTNEPVNQTNQPTLFRTLWWVVCIHWENMVTSNWTSQPGEPVWSSGKALGCKQKDLGSIPFRLSSLLESCGLWTMSCDFVPHH